MERLQLVILGTAFFLEELKESLKEYSQIVFVNKDDVDYSSPVLYLFYGENSSDADYKEISLNTLVQDEAVLPIVKNLKDFNAFVPTELYPINAFELSSPTEIPSLRNFILNHFGVIHSNRKIFISYKRSDTEGIAHELFSTLLKKKFHPFLDCYSISSGVDFQAYLKHELSDSDVLIVLNSPNFLLSEYTREELRVATTLGIGILNICFPGSKQILEASFGYTLNLEDKYLGNGSITHDGISRIVSTLEIYRAKAYEAKHNHLVKILKERTSSSFVESKGLFFETNSLEVFKPIPRIPCSEDCLTLFEMPICACYKRKSIIYNGIYTLESSKRHLEWLSNNLPVKIIDINK